MKRIILIVACLLAGCATEQEFRKRMDRTIGMSEDQLVSFAGQPPAQSHDTEPVNGRKQRYVAWAMHSQDTIPGYWQCYGTFCWVQPPVTYQYFCNVTFRLEDGRVTEYRYNGNGCKA